jgi:hypothetical protein
MLAARNRRFRIAAVLAAAAYLILTARDVIEADHIFRPEVAGGYKVSTVLFLALHLVATGGWLVIATAFAREIRWPRLRVAAAIAASAYVVGFFGWMFRLAPVLDEVTNADYRGLSIAHAAGAFLFAVGALTIVHGLAASRRGATRASWIWAGMILVTVSSLANTVGLLYEQSFYAAATSADELKIGLLIQAIGAFGAALAALAFTVGVRRPLGRREAALAAAAAGAAAAYICILGGELVIAIAYVSHRAPTWQDALLWIAVAYRLLLAAALACVALGARAAREPVPVPA